MRTWMRVAEIVKAKTLQGGLVLRSVAGLPFLLHEGMGVSFVPPQFDCPRSAIVVSAVPSLKNDNYLVQFDRITNRDVAEKLVGCFCLAKAEDIDAVSLTRHEQHEHSLLGYRVVDETHGDLGEVCEVELNAWQVLLVVEGGKGTISIPSVDEFVLEEDAEARILRTRIPEGLLGLARTEAAEGDET